MIRSILSFGLLATCLAVQAQSPAPARSVSPDRVVHVQAAGRCSAITVPTRSNSVQVRRDRYPSSRRLCSVAAKLFNAVVSRTGSASMVGQSTSLS